MSTNTKLELAKHILNDHDIPFTEEYYPNTPAFTKLVTTKQIYYFPENSNKVVSRERDET